VYNVLTTFRSH